VVVYQLDVKKTVALDLGRVRQNAAPGPSLLSTIDLLFSVSRRYGLSWLPSAVERTHVWCISRILYARLYRRTTDGHRATRTMVTSEHR